MISQIYKIVQLVLEVALFCDCFWKYFLQLVITYTLPILYWDCTDVYKPYQYKMIKHQDNASDLSVQ